jgi:hypothetical protein
MLGVYIELSPELTSPGLAKSKNDATGGGGANSKR